jgi:hypothetical protein
MSFGAVAVVVCVVTVLLGILATHPLELREHRWLKIALSLPIVVLIASVFDQITVVGGYFAMFGIGVLGFIWKSPIAHLYAAGFCRLIYGDMNRNTGIRPNFHGPKALRSHGDLDDAIALTLAELEKDPHNYEGLLLLSELYEQSQGDRAAIPPLHSLLQKARLTNEQRAFIRARIEKLNERLIVAELNAR